MSRVHTKPDTWRKKRLAESIGRTDTLIQEQRQELIDFLGEHHAAFALEDHERGETDLVEFTIETGDADPQRCAPRRMPFAVREEVARQLRKMQEAHIIQPSTSPWASPVVMVRKKDGSHRFCVDYRRLNAVTKADTYPLPRIDDLLDQLGQFKYFSTLDLASGYWQIKVATESQEKTAFITPQGLYEFLVMPFGLTNAPAVFQRLMQRVLAGLNPEAGPDFVAVYIDDILIFSRTIEEHLMHHDTVKFMAGCPQCAVVTGGSRQHRPPLHPIPVSRPFQIIGVGIMELPTTERGNRYVLVFQDFLTKWPMVYPMPDQKSLRIAELLVNEVIPQFGVPESLPSDRGTNLLSHLMTDVCRLLGIKKLNTTSHHPQCDGMVERFNRTLKTMLRKYAAEFSTQWDRYLPGALWAYCNVPHDSTGEKPSFLLYGLDCRTPTEAALLPAHVVEPTEVSDYREELVLFLSTARRLAAEAIQMAQTKRVVWCPPELPAGFYWYGSRRSTPGRPPRWVDKLLQETIPPTAPEPQNSTDAGVGTQSSPDNTEDRNEPESENAESGPDGDVPQDPTTDPDVGQDEIKDSTSDSTGDGDQDESPDEDLAVTGNTLRPPMKSQPRTITLHRGRREPPPRLKKSQLKDYSAGQDFEPRRLLPPA